MNESQNELRESQKEYWGKMAGHPISDQELAEINENLLNFFKVLISIDDRIESEKSNQRSLDLEELLSSKP